MLKAGYLLLLCRSCGRNRRLILGNVQLLPFALFDAVANLGSGFSLLALLVGIQRFPDAHAAFSRMLARVAVQQAAVTLAAIAVAIAGLLVQHALHSSSQCVGILHHDVVEL